MIPLDSAEIAAAVGGRLAGVPDPRAVVCTSGTTDSREVVDGTLFVAKPGEVTDGHRFVPQAHRSGAALALVEHEVRDEDGEPYPCVVVEDVVLAMGALAHEIVVRLRARGGITVFGITGSAGKTTTKDLLAGILAQDGPTVAPVGSFNGEVGVPLTVFRAEEDTRYLVIEMGADHVGNIRYLCDMVEPDFGAILKVGTAHAGEFGGVENIALTKSELADGVRTDGGILLNIDDPRVFSMIDKASAEATYFGVEGRHQSAADPAAAGGGLIEARGLSTDPSGRPAFDLVFPRGGTHRVESRLIGEHHVHNLLAAAGLALAAGIGEERIVHGLNTLGPASRYRMERTDRADGVTVINDAYNANPESMAAALRTLARMGRDAVPPRRAWAVLGPMLELGDLSVEEHSRVGRDLVRLNVSKLVAVGDEARPIFNSAVLEGSWGSEAVWVRDCDTAFELLREELREGDIALFKSSNGAGLRFLGDRVAQDVTGPTGHDSSGTE